MPRGRPKGSKNKTSQVQKQANKQSITININDKPKRKYTRRKQENKKQDTTEVIPMPAINYGAVQEAAGYQHNRRPPGFMPYTMPSIIGESEPANDLVGRIINQIEINGTKTEEVVKDTKQQVKPDEQKTSVGETLKPISTEDVKKVVDGSLDANDAKNFVLNSTANTVGTIAGVAGLAGAGAIYRNRNVIKGKLSGVASAFKGLGETLGGTKGTPWYKKKGTLDYERLNDTPSPSLKSAVSPTAAADSTKGFTSNSTSFSAYRKKLAENFDEIQPSTIPVIKKSATPIIPPSSSPMIRPNSTPDNYAASTENLIEIFTNKSSSEYRKKDGTIDLRKYMNKRHPTGPATPTPQAQSTLVSQKALITPKSIDFSPIAPAPATQAKIVVRPEASRAGTRSSSRASNASDKSIFPERDQHSIRGLLTPSKNVTIPNQTNPTPSAFMKPASRNSSRNSNRVSPAPGQSILQQTQKSSYTPPNTEFVTKRKKTTKAPTPAASRTPTPVSSIMEESVHLLTGGMLRSSKKGRDSSMMSKGTTLPTTDYPSKAPEYIAGYNDRVKVRIQEGEKPKPWTRDTNMKSPYSIGYYGNRTDDTIEKYMNKTPPPRRHGNTKIKDTKNDKTRSQSR